VESAEGNCRTGKWSWITGVEIEINDQMSLGAKLRNNLGQVVHTYVPLSLSSITWYRRRGSDALRLGR